MLLIYTGLLVVTLPGAYLSSRVGSSLMSTIGVPHTIVKSLKVIISSSSLIA